MLHSLSLRIANRFFDSSDKYPIDVYVYGIELLVSSLISTILILAVGLLTGTFAESLIFLLSFSCIRVYTGGYHSMTYLRCTVISVLSYVLIAFSLIFFSHVFSNIFLMTGVYVLTIALALIFAPIPHENKELTQAERKKYKLLSLLMITVFYSLSSVCYYILSVEQTLVILPTCLSIDIAMAVSIVKNYINLRRKQK